jgi:hypothetical protein
MRRFWLVLLSLGLIAAFSTQAMAVDVKFSGEYYAAGMYLDKTTFKENTATDGPSTAFYFQRLRLTTEFVVAPGLTLTTRADIMERAWGAARSNPGTALDTLSAGTRAENENIAFDYAYLLYISPIGGFRVGYAPVRYFGTTFGDNTTPAGSICYIIQQGGFLGTFTVAQLTENSRTANFASTGTDRDSVEYTLWGLYRWRDGEAGLLLDYVRDASNRDLGLPGPFAGTGYLSDVFVVNPYAKMKFGPVALQAEFGYMFGKATKWEGPGMGVPDIELSQWYGMIDAQANLGMFYAGGMAAYATGDDPATADKMEGGALTGGIDWNPCLILFNNDLNYWTGGQPGYNGTANAGPMTNAWLLQLRGGVKPMDKLDIMASVSYATADKTPAAIWVSREYGYEVDLTGTYKITNNLSYMLGAAYLFTGDYYKGASADNEVKDNFMVINKLTLTF